MSGLEIRHFAGTPKPVNLQSQQVVRRNWFGKTQVILQVRYYYGGPWRDATAADLKALDETKARQFQADHSNGFFPIGARVMMNSRTGFSSGGWGTVVFQEPSQGRVWVLREGAQEPVYFYGYELSFSRSVFSAPEQKSLYPDRTDWWWIAVGEGRLDAEEAQSWVDANIPDPRSRALVLTRDSPEATEHFTHMVGFARQEDATLFYLSWK